MRSAGKPLLALVAMVTAAAALAYLPRGTAAREAARSEPPGLVAVPGWVVSVGGATDLLPEDPRAMETRQWTYRNGERVVWVAVGLYPSRNDPQTRPSLDRLLVKTGATELRREEVLFPSGEASGPVVPVNQVVATLPKDQFSVIYWYQIGTQSIAGEYRLRWVLFRNTLLGRRQPVTVVRIGTVGGEGKEAQTSEMLQGFVKAFQQELVRALES